MPTPEERFSILRPLTLAERIRLVRYALSFFAPFRYRDNCKVLGLSGDGPVLPFSGAQFADHLEKTRAFPNANRHMFRIRELLAGMAAKDVLLSMGASQLMLGGPHYYFLKELTSLQRRGLLWLTEVLGAEFVYYHLGSITHQITGTTNSGDVVAGTAISVGGGWLLTCGHVLTDMKVDPIQQFRGRSHTVLRSCVHGKHDVGLLLVDPQPTTLPDVAFSDPIVGEAVYTLGYPRIPLSAAPAAVMHRGEVTNPMLTTLANQAIFLFSAVARPGNSGGPIISERGAIVGIVSQELSEVASRSGAPFFAGIRTSEIAEAAKELAPGLQLPIEDYT